MAETAKKVAQKTILFPVEDRPAKLVVTEDDIERIITTIKNKLRFIIYVPHDSVNASAMFEIINNRGKNLSELEKIKNYFVYLAMFLGKDNSLHETINIC